MITSVFLLPSLTCDKATCNITEQLKGIYKSPKYEEPACQNVLVVMTKYANLHISFSAVGEN
jgi:hypothetical protein